MSFSISVPGSISLSLIMITPFSPEMNERDELSFFIIDLKIIGP